MASGLETAALKQTRRKRERAGNRGPSAFKSAVKVGSYRLLFEGVGKGPRTVRSVNDSPRHDETLIIRACPFEVSDSDPAARARSGRVYDVPIPQCVDVPLSLYAQLVPGHRTRHVGCENQFQVDCGRRDHWLGLRTADARPENDARRLQQK